MIALQAKGGELIMPNFQPGDFVYHKATEIRGVIARKEINPLAPNEWIVAWADGKRGPHAEAELWTEEEYKQRKEV